MSNSEIEATNSIAMQVPLRVAIQGELGSNSHMAVLGMLGDSVRPIELVSCALSAEVFKRLEDGSVELAVLPIENSLHGSVFEHYDLLLEHGVIVIGETLLRIRHNVIAAPGVLLAEVKRVTSHPVALSQCRRWLRDHPEIEVVPGYDTAGSVKDLMANGSRDVAGIAPELAARQYGAAVIVAGIEDHPENYTRFYALAPKDPIHDEKTVMNRVHGFDGGPADKMTLAFSVAHRPGTLIEVLEVFRDAGLNLTRIESRPVHGRPWEYVFFVDVRFEQESVADAVVERLRGQCEMMVELGRYRAA